MDDNEWLDCWGPISHSSKGASYPRRQDVHRTSVLRETQKGNGSTFHKDACKVALDGGAPEKASRLLRER